MTGWNRGGVPEPHSRNEPALREVDDGGLDIVVDRNGEKRGERGGMEERQGGREG